MDDRLQAIRERVERATKGPWKAAPMEELFPDKKGWQPGSWGCVYDGKPWNVCTQADAEFKAHAREDIPFLLAKLDQAGKLAEDLEMLTDQKGEIGSFLKARFPASLKIAQDSLDAWKGTPTPPEAKP